MSSQGQFSADARRVQLMDRERKRESAKKHREFSVYTKKAVRIKEALIEKQKNTSHASQGGSKSN